MEFMSQKFQYAFNCVQLVAYVPEGLVKEGPNKFVGMNFHADNKQYLSGSNMEFLPHIAVATLNIYTSLEDNNWKFIVQPKVTHHLQHDKFSFPLAHGDVYYQPPGLFYLTLLSK